MSKTIRKTGSPSAEAGRALTKKERHGHSKMMLTDFAGAYRSLAQKELAQTQPPPTDEQIEEKAIRMYREDYPDLDTNIPDGSMTYRELFTGFLKKNFDYRERSEQEKQYYRELRPRAEKAAFDAVMSRKIPEGRFDFSGIQQIRQPMAFYLPGRDKEYQELLYAFRDAESGEWNAKVRLGKMVTDWLLDNKVDGVGVKEYFAGIGKMSDEELIKNWPTIHRLGYCAAEAMQYSSSDSALNTCGRYAQKEVEQWERDASTISAQYDYAAVRLSRLANPLTELADDAPFLKQTTVRMRKLVDDPATKNVNFLKSTMMMSSKLQCGVGPDAFNRIRENGFHNDHCQYFTLDGERFDEPGFNDRLLTGEPMFVVDASQPDKEPMLMQYSGFGDFKTGEEALQTATDVKKPGWLRRALFTVSPSLTEAVFGTQAVTDLKSWYRAEKIRGGLQSGPVREMIQANKRAAQLKAPDAPKKYEKEAAKKAEKRERQKAEDVRYQIDRKEQAEMTGRIRKSCLEKLQKGGSLADVIGELTFCAQIEKTVSKEPGEKGSLLWSKIKAQPDRWMNDYKASEEYKAVITGMGREKPEVYLPEEKDRNALLTGGPEGMQALVKLQNALQKKRDELIKQMPKGKGFRLADHLKEVSRVDPQNRNVMTGNATKDLTNNTVEKTGSMLTGSHVGP